MNAQLLTISTPGEHAATRPAQDYRAGAGATGRYANLVFVVLLTIFFGVCGWRLLDPQFLPIKHVRIEGNFQHLSPEKMQTMVSAVIRGGFFNLNVMHIKEALLEEPWVNWVAVQRVWPDGLSVHVKEQTAAAHWNATDLLNDSARIFSPQSAHTIAGIPYLSGPKGTQKLVFRRYGEIVDALKPYAITVERLSLSERRAWRFQIYNGPLVILGRNNVDSRIERFRDSVLGSLREELVKVNYIDLRYTNGFAIQWLDNNQNSIEPGTQNNG